MTTAELQQKHNKAIMDGLISSNDYLMANAAKQCALITIEHTIGVLEEMNPTNYDAQHSELLAVVKKTIDSKISELKKQKEGLL
jgi:hypothetical protein